MHWKEGELESVWRELTTTADAAILAEPFAYRRNLHRGDRFELETANCRSSFRVAGIDYDYGSDQGVVMLGVDAFRADFGEPGVAVLAVFAEPGADLEQLKTAVESAAPEGELAAQSSRLLKQMSVESSTAPSASPACCACWRSPWPSSASWRRSRPSSSSAAGSSPSCAPRASPAVSSSGSSPPRPAGWGSLRAPAAARRAPRRPHGARHQPALVRLVDGDRLDGAAVRRGDAARARCGASRRPHSRVAARAHPSGSRPEAGVTVRTPRRLVFALLVFVGALTAPRSHSSAAPGALARSPPSSTSPKRSAADWARTTSASLAPRRRATSRSPPTTVPTTASAPSGGT